MRSLLLLCLLISSGVISAQSPLQKEIARVAAMAQGRVYVACSLPRVVLDCDLNAHGHPPMQSVFKFPLAVTVLHEVQQGKFKLDQPIRFLASDRYPGTYSPLQDAHPAGDVDVPLSELLQLAVGKSDNTAADILLRIIGGPMTVQRYMDSLGLRAIHVRDSERGMHDNLQAQYRNDAEPAALVKLLRMLAERSPLNAQLTTTLDVYMTATTTGKRRIKGLLPAGTVVAHKTGTSGVTNGLAHATNDAGLITLPDGRRLALVVFISDSRADESTREAVIAKIAKAIYDEAIGARR